jgi:hypothetical protein
MDMIGLMLDNPEVLRRKDCLEFNTSIVSKLATHKLMSRSSRGSIAVNNVVLFNRSNHVSYSSRQCFF